MEKDQFVAVENQGWWLLEPDLDAALEERRRTLGECWDWTDLRWYAERLKLEEVYQFLELNRADLLRGSMTRATSTAAKSGSTT